MKLTFEQIKVESIAYHRNGVGGNGFHVVIFKWKDDSEKKLRNMVATLQDEPGQCFVLDLNETLAGNVEMAKGNSWRGDHFEAPLKAAIKGWEDKRLERLQLNEW